MNLQLLQVPGGGVPSGPPDVLVALFVLLVVVGFLFGLYRVAQSVSNHSR